jgi:hypothetical protein
LVKKNTFSFSSFTDRHRSHGVVRPLREAPDYQPRRFWLRKKRPGGVV